MGENKILAHCTPQLPLKVINLKNGYNRDNKTWLLGRCLKDYNY
jgi:hypothetical protein